MSQISCLNIKEHYSIFKYLSFKVLHDHISRNHDFAHFRGAPIFGEHKKGVRGVKKNWQAIFFCILCIAKHHKNYILKDFKSLNLMYYTTI